MIKNNSSDNLTPLPIAKGHWLLKNIPNMSKNIFTHFYEREKELGHTFENPVPTIRLISTSEPGFMRHVLQTNHRNYKKGRREYLFQNATTFNPDRFQQEAKKNMTKMSYLPFGGGPRLCIGNMFALMEMQLILVGLLQRFDFQLIADQVIDKEALVTLRPRYGIKMMLS